MIDIYGSRNPIRYEVGDTIEYEAFGGERRIVLVDTKEADIKNGRPGFGGVCTQDAVSGYGPGQGMRAGDGAWGYDDQIIRVVARAPKLVETGSFGTPVTKSGQCGGSGRVPDALVSVDRKTTCPGCGYPITVNTDGRVRAHRRPR